MRTTMFGDTIIEDIEDDLGSIEAFQNANGKVHAIIRSDEEVSSMYRFEIIRNDDGNDIVSSESIFETSQDATDYLNGWVTDIQFE